MDPKFFRKYADLINEAEILPTASKNAKKVARGVSKISGMGDDHGYEWLDNWDSPIGDAWRSFFDDPAGADSNTELEDWIERTVDAQVLAEYAADVQSWVNDAKFDIYD
jgi:hypothetical protein